MGGECLLQRYNKELLLQIINNKTGLSEALNVENSHALVTQNNLDCFDYFSLL